MKRLSEKIAVIAGTVTLAVGLTALPVLAGTTQQQGNGWVGQMQGFMQQTFSPDQHQTLMNSTAMQNLHNSAGMQQARQTGDLKAMQELMNSDPTVKAQIGQGSLDKMNQYMSDFSGNIVTDGSGNPNSGRSMMNGSRTFKTGSNMMNF
jgi:hypothetical protein